MIKETKTKRVTKQQQLMLKGILEITNLKNQSTKSSHMSMDHILFSLKLIFSLPHSQLLGK